MIDVKEMYDYYCLGNSFKDCGIKYNISITQVGRLFKKNNFKARELGSFRRDKKRSNIDEDFFNIIDSEEKAYFIGFIAADGHITKDQRRIIISLQKKDNEILLKFTNMLNYGNIKYREYFDKRTNKTYYHSILEINSVKLVKSLEKYGLTNNKTKDYIIKNIPEQYIKDCIRGLFDGDGSIAKTSISLVSTLENINFIKNWLKSNGIKCNKTDSLKCENNVYVFRISKDRFKFLDLIYKDNKISLDRKYRKYISLNRIKNSAIRYREILVYKDDILCKKFNSVKECKEFFNCDHKKIYYACRKNTKIDGFNLRLGNLYINNVQRIV